MAVTSVTGDSTGLVTLVANTTQSFDFPSRYGDYIEIVNTIASPVYFTIGIAEVAVTPATDGTFAVNASSTARFRWMNNGPTDTIINVESAGAGDICIQLLSGELH